MLTRRKTERVNCCLFFSDFTQCSEIWNVCLSEIWVWLWVKSCSCCFPPSALPTFRYQIKTTASCQRIKFNLCIKIWYCSRWSSVESSSIQLQKLHHIYLWSRDPYICGAHPHGQQVPKEPGNEERRWDGSKLQMWILVTKNVFQYFFACQKVCPINRIEIALVSLHMPKYQNVGLHWAKTEEGLSLLYSRNWLNSGVKIFKHFGIEHLVECEIP